MIPLATYRLQFHSGFPFAAAIPLAPYLARLGVSHVYASPIATARAGSAHGYDVVDPTRINPELGGEDGFCALAAALKAEGLGLILDIVPNHLAVGFADNRWWTDVLEKGEASAFSELFDIDWQAPDPALRGKVLAPFLGAPYAEALAAGDIRLRMEPEGTFAVWAHGVHRFPIRRQDYDQAASQGAGGFDPADEAGRARLHALIERQNWRLSWWRTAGDEINWRRFFDITTLAAVRAERPDAFELIHALPLRLYAAGLIDGVRADHVDGLTDPGGYGRTLRHRFSELRPGDHAYIVIEKVLAPGEALAPDWGVDGTTGYDFMDQVSRLLHHPAGAAPLARSWAEISGRSPSFAAEEAAARRQVLSTMFAGQLASTTRAFHALARSDLPTRDITAGAIERALTSLVTGFPAYRTYATAAGLPDWDEPMLDQDVVAAHRLAAQWEGRVLDQIAAWLKGDGEPTLRAEAARRWQQLSAAVAAKAVEDTAFYRYGRLLSRNEVGSHPARVSSPPEAIHVDFAGRGVGFPDAMLTTATHDHKRGEDIRARLAVLSELPERWIEAVAAWRELNRPHGRGVDAGDELMLYQTLAGAWPLDLSPADAAGLAAFQARIDAWQRKALREAKLRSSWAEPDEAYEGRCEDFVGAVLDPALSGPFLAALASFVDAIAPAGAMNSLAQALLRCTSPGAPDLYQGCELWDFSLVDPDNRRPVDYGARIAALAAPASPPQLIERWRDGRVKQALIRAALAARAAHPALFANGGYRPLFAQGPRAGSVFAFARTSQAAAAIVVVTIRAAGAVAGAAQPLASASWWADTELLLPDELAARRWSDLFGGEERSAPIALAALLDRLPVALLSSA